MDELTAIRQLLAEPAPPEPDVVAAARARLEHTTRGTGVPRWRAPRRPWRLAATAGAAAAVAAAIALIAAQATAVGGASAAGALTVRELAYRTAAAAERQPQVRPSQWVYWKETRSRAASSVFQVWTTADSAKAAFVAHGKVQAITLTGRGHVQYVGQPEGSSLSGTGTSISGETATLPVAYSGLGSLPRSPRALLRYLADLPLPHRSGWGPAPAREFEIIEDLVTTYVMPPRLTAALYQALGAIPGVTVNGHAADVAGRHGVGFISPALPGAGNEELIFDPRSYDLMGNDLLLGPGQQPLNGTAILQRALVSGPGVSPGRG
jgi:hypothetical protein